MSFFANAEFRSKLHASEASHVRFMRTLPFFCQFGLTDPSSKP